MKRKIAIFICLVLIFLVGCSNTKKMDGEPITRTDFVIGTVVTITIFDDDREQLLDMAFDKLLEIENLMSANLDASDIGKVNKEAGIKAVEVSKQTMEVVKKGIEYGETSSGKFDITMEPIVYMWNIGTDKARVPKEQEINEALKYVDYSKVVIDEQNNTIFLPEKNMGIDLGGIAKGYATDEVVKLLRENGVKKAILNLGGNVYAIGTKNEDSLWNIGIQNPFDERNNYFAIVSVADETVVTSGPYERYFEVEDGKRYHHIFDTSTGYPIENTLGSVTVITKNSIDADALSTTLFSLDIEMGLELAESLDGVECIFVDGHKNVYISSGLKDGVNITDNSFKLMKLFDWQNK